MIWEKEIRNLRCINLCPVKVVYMERQRYKKRAEDSPVLLYNLMEWNPRKSPVEPQQCSLPSQRHCCPAGSTVFICDPGRKEVIYSHPSNLGVRKEHNPPITTVPGLLKWDVEHVRDCSVRTSLFLVSHSRVFIMCKWRSVVSSHLAHRGTLTRVPVQDLMCSTEQGPSPRLRVKILWRSSSTWPAQF